MNGRRFLFLFLVLICFWVFKPAKMWDESKRIWAQRELILRILVTLIVAYFAYGLYELYRQGWFAP
jgi:hypothetical protein